MALEAGPPVGEQSLLRDGFHRFRRAITSPSLESLFVLTVVLFGYRVGGRPIGDNSMLTHLRTGIDMATTGAIPRKDPYSYTAFGHDWVVQSWFPEWTYGWAFRIGGMELVVFEQALLVALLVWLVVRLARTGSPLRTALAGLTAVGVGAAFWTPRPLLFGLICMALLITVVERRRSPWLLVPILWVWVNSHGSFPLGAVWLGAVLVGQLFDSRALPRHDLRYLWGYLAGLAVSVLNPLGPKLLFFPLTLGEKQESFRNIVEWRSPDFSRAGGYFALSFLVLALLILLRGRPGWRDILPVIGFLGAGLVAARNIGVLGLVLAPALGRALTRQESAEGVSAEGVPAPVGADVDPAAGLGLAGGFEPDEEPAADTVVGAADRPPSGRSSEDRVQINRLMLLALLAAFVVFTVPIATESSLDLIGYPDKAMEHLRDQGRLEEPHRLVEQDFIGNYLEFQWPDVPVFVDDRFDMYPLSVARDYEALLNGRPDSVEVLDRWKADTVLWQKKLPLVAILGASGWRETYSDKDWVVLER